MQTGPSMNRRFQSALLCAIRLLTVCALLPKASVLTATAGGVLSPTSGGGRSR